MAQKHKPSILVLGGDSHFYYLMRRYIRMSSHRILIAHQDVLEIAQQEKPAAIIMDIAMPGMVTLKLLNQLKTDPCTSKIPVILCSWLEEDGLLLENGADVILHMPILYEDFASALVRTGVTAEAKRTISDPAVTDTPS